MPAVLECPVIVDPLLELSCPRKIVPEKKSCFAKTVETIIVGGGTSGAYLGYNLARAGIETVIIDNGTLLDQPYQGFLSHRTLKRFPILKAIHGPKKFGSNLQVVTPNGSMFEVTNSTIEMITGVTRPTINSFLLEAAVRKGARFEKSQVVDIERENGGCVVKTTRGKIRGRFLIGADGVGSIVRRRVLGEFDRDDVELGLGAYVNGIEDNSYKIHFTSSGNIRIAPSDQLHSIGITGALTSKALLTSELECCLREHYPSVSVVSKWSGYRPSPHSASFFDKPTSGRDWMLIGNAAGHVNVFTGEGIFYSLWSAEIASKAIESCDLRVYDTLWRQEYGKELKAASRLRQQFNSIVVLNKILKIASKSETAATLFSEYLMGISNPDQIYKDVALKLPRVILERVLRFVK